MASLAAQYKVASITYAILGKSAVASALDYYGQQFITNTLTADAFATSLLNGADGQARFSGKTTSEIIQTIYTNVHGVAPTPAQLSTLLGSGQTVPQMINSIVSDLLNYTGSDATTVTQASAFDNTVKGALFPSVITAAASGTGAADYLAICQVLGTTKDANAINYWGSHINNGSLSALTAAQVTINDRSYISSLSDTDFVARLFQFG